MDHAMTKLIKLIIGQSIELIESRKIKHHVLKISHGMHVHTNGQSFLLYMSMSN
jgi:hypothetical protein